MSTPPPLSSSTVSNNDNNNCQSIMDRREECYRKNDLGEYHRDHENEKKSKYSKCWIPLLRAKRCLAFQHCAREAVEYYQTPSDKIVEGVNGPKDKGYCASYDESYCAYKIIALSDRYRRSGGLAPARALSRTLTHSRVSFDFTTLFSSLRNHRTNQLC
jgi:hypothetical protein